MSSTRLMWAVAAAAVVVASGSPPVAANIIIDNQIFITSQGFGAAPRILTVQQMGNSPNPPGTESGCGANSGGSLITGSSACLTTDASISGNGFKNAGGDEATGGSNKFDLVNLGSAGVADASQIVIIYNSSQTSSPSTDITDVTLKFYNSSNNLVASVDGGCGTSFPCANDLSFASETPGNGGAGFALVLDAAQAAAVDAIIGANWATTTAALEATITNANDGPESFRLFGCIPGTPNCSFAPPLPEPGSLGLLVVALAALGLIRYHKPV